MEGSLVSQLCERDQPLDHVQYAADMNEHLFPQLNEERYQSCMNASRTAERLVPDSPFKDLKPDTCPAKIAAGDLHLLLPDLDALPLPTVTAVPSGIADCRPSCGQVRRR